MLNFLLKNGSAEQDIRDWLSRNGYCGRTAQFAEVELHAIQRPGWVQVFRFQVIARDREHRPQSLAGAMRTDERYGPPQIAVYCDARQRNHQLEKWSTNLIIRRPQRSVQQKNGHHKSSTR